jgi:hypothetical protein
VSVSLGIMLEGEAIEPTGHIWLSADRLKVSVRIGEQYAPDTVSIQGAPEDMERLAEAARSAAEQARAAEPELRAELRAKAGEETTS